MTNCLHWKFGTEVYYCRAGLSVRKYVGIIHADLADLPFGKSTGVRTADF
jgi:hypothetical protein